MCNLPVKNNDAHVFTLNSPLPVHVSDIGLCVMSESDRQGLHKVFEACLVSLQCGLMGALQVLPRLVALVHNNPGCVLHIIAYLVR